MNLTDFKKRLLWGLGILFIFIVWITFPLIFKTWVFTLIVKPPFTPLEFASLGPIGDIFGGLTAFFTSLTLIIVLYSAYLQRQANKDAREAMSEQLKQAKEASAEQLKQAKESTRQQLELARDTHSSQIKETQYSIFSNIFYSLLNQKHERSRVIFFEKDEQKIDLYQMFEYVNAKIFSLVDNQWKDVSDITISDLKKEFDLLLVEKISSVNHLIFIHIF